MNYRFLLFFLLTYPACIPTLSSELKSGLSEDASEFSLSEAPIGITSDGFF